MAAYVEVIKDGRRYGGVGVNGKVTVYPDGITNGHTVVWADSFGRLVDATVAQHPELNRAVHQGSLDRSAPICPDCAGFTMSYACSLCGHEGKLYGGRRCARCTLDDRIAELLDDGTGRIHSRLVPLAEQLLGMDKPLSGLTWLSASCGATGR